MWNREIGFVKFDRWNGNRMMKKISKMKKRYRWNYLMTLTYNIDRWYFLMTLKYLLLHRWNFHTKHDDCILNRHFGSRFECPYFISNLNHWHTRCTENTNSVTDHIEYIIFLFSIIFNHTSSGNFFLNRQLITIFSHRQLLTEKRWMVKRVMA